MSGKNGVIYSLVHQTMGRVGEMVLTFGTVVGHPVPIAFTSVKGDTVTMAAACVGTFRFTYIYTN